MKKSTKTYLMIAAAVAAAWYVYQQTQAANANATGATGPQSATGQ